MHNQDEEQLMFKKKKPSFTEWTLQNGVSVNNKSSTKPVGAIHESPAKTNTISTITPAKTSDTYATSNRDLQNIHRNRTNAERHTGRSLRDESNRRTTNVGAIQESPAFNHRFVGKAETTANETYSANPYGSPVKIVGDNVTKKDYDDFRNAFHEESTGEKLNWAASQLQAKPKQQQTNVQTTPQTRRSQNMMQWAMRERENLTEPQSPGKKQYITDEKDPFLEGFNQDSEEEEKWNRMLDTVERGVRIYKGEEKAVSPYEKAVVDVLRAYNTSGPLQRAKEKVANSMNDFNALKGYLNGDYSEIDFLTQVLGWDQSRKEKFLSAINRNSKEKNFWERRLNDAEVITQVAGGFLDKAYPYIEEKMLRGPWSPVYIYHEKLEDALKAAHYSRNYFNESAPQSIPEAEAMGWVLEEKDQCHQDGVPGRTNVKYIPSDGSDGEQIFKADGTVDNSPENMATPNIFNPNENSIWHGFFDLAPWLLWGNSPEDSTTALERVFMPFSYWIYETLSDSEK